MATNFVATKASFPSSTPLHLQRSPLVITVHSEFFPFHLSPSLLFLLFHTPRHTSFPHIYILSLLTGDSDSKESACNARDPGLIPGLGRFPGEGNSNHSSVLAWRIPWTEEPSWLPSMGVQTIGHDWVTFPFTPHSMHLVSQHDLSYCTFLHPEMSSWVSLRTYFLSYGLPLKTNFNWVNLKI